MEEQGWGSGESSRLPPMCPVFDSQTRRHVWVEFVVGFYSAPRGFSPGSPVFPSSKRTSISKFQFDFGIHGHFCSSTCELLGVLWVNKLLLHITFPFPFTWQ